MPIATCPQCEAEIHVEEETDKGETMVCTECDAKLEVVGLDPVELDFALEEDEEYDDDDEY